MKTNGSRVFFGLMVILLGTGLLGQAIGWWDLVGFAGWWTLFIIVPAICLIISCGPRFWNLLLLSVGVLLLLKEQEIITSRMVTPIIVAGLVILLGLHIIFGNRFHTVRAVPGAWSVPPASSAQPDFTVQPNYSIIFGEVKVKNVSQSLISCKVSVVFGYMEVDLTEIGAAGDITVETSAVFGGLRIYAPRNLRVKVESSSVFGGCDNRAATLTDTTRPLVTIKASTVFGGTEVL